ncbi:hypothetical protein RQP46_009792 [Phenoliferia psychrophenolica]
MTTWADRARAASSAVPKPLAPVHASAAAPVPVVSKASSSDNWRQPAPSTPSPSSEPSSSSGDGWKVAEKKERKPSPAVVPTPRERKEKSSSSSLLAVPASTSAPASTSPASASSSWAAASASDALPSPTFAPVVVSSAPVPVLALESSGSAAAAAPTPPSSAAALPQPTEPTLAAPPPPPPSLPPKINPWCQVKKPVVAPVPVLADWPSPQEPAPSPSSQKNVKEARKRDASGNSASDESALKKKAEKTTWVPIKVDITVAHPNSSPRPSTGSSEKRPKQARVPGSGPAAAGGAPRAAHDRAAGTAPRPSSSAPTAAATGATKKELNAPRPAQSKPPLLSSASSSALPPVPSSSSSSKTAALPNGSGSTTKPAPAARADFALPKKPVVPSSSSTPSSSALPKASSSSSSSRPPVPATTTTSTTTAPVLRPFSDPSASVPFISKPQRAAAAEYDAAFTPAPPNGFPRNNHPNQASTRGGARGGATFPRGRGALAGVPRGPFSGQGQMRQNGFAQQGALSVQQQQEQAAALAQQHAAYMAAYQTPVMTPEEETKYWLLGQIEYYFSVDNLCHDMFLRSKMDTEGWLDIALIGSFNRIKNLSQDPALVLATMLFTPLLEVSRSNTHVRLASGWPHWVLPNAVPSVVQAPGPAEPRTNGVNGNAELDDGHESTSEDDEGTATSRAATTVSSGSQPDESQAGEHAKLDQHVPNGDVVAVEPKAVEASA